MYVCIGSPVVSRYLTHLILISIFLVHIHVYDDVLGIYDTLFSGNSLGLKKRFLFRHFRKRRAIAI